MDREHQFPAAEYLGMQHAHPKIATQAMDTFQVIVVNPKYLQVHLHVLKGKLLLSYAEKYIAATVAGTLAGMDMKSMQTMALIGVQQRRLCWCCCSSSSRGASSGSSNQAVVCCTFICSRCLNLPTSQNLPGDPFLQNAEGSTRLYRGIMQVMM